MTDHERDKLDIQRKREFTVCKSNDFIQDGFVSRSFSQMTAQQIDLLNYIISKIKPTDELGQTYKFSVIEFSKVYNKDFQGGYTYKTIKDDLKAIASINDFVDIGGGRERQVKYLDDVIIDRGSGVLEVSFHKSIYPYLYNLTGKKYYFPVGYQAAMKSPYSKLLYELLKSVKNLSGNKVFSIDFLRQTLGAETYKRFPDMRRFVLDKAIQEINWYSDIAVEYEPKKTGRAITHIVFVVRDVEPFQMTEMADGTIEVTISTEAAARKVERNLVLDPDTIQHFKEAEERTKKAVEEMEREQEEIKGDKGYFEEDEI